MEVRAAENCEVPNLPQHITAPLRESSEPAGRAMSGTPVLWTAWLDYFATGEGRSLMACIAFASNEAEIRAHFGRTFDPWYAHGCEAGPGVVRNDLTRTLWSTAALKMIESCAAQGAWVDAQSWLHFNFS